MTEYGFRVFESVYLLGNAITVNHAASCFYTENPPEQMWLFMREL